MSIRNDDGHNLAQTEREKRDAELEAAHPAVMLGQPTFPALGELPVHGVRIPTSEVERVQKQQAWEDYTRRRAFKARRFSTLTDAEVKEVMAYDLTPAARKVLDKVNPTVSEAQTLKGSDVLLFNALAGDGPVTQLRPPPVPEVTSPAFKLGVFCGLLVGSGVAASLPYIVEALKGWL